MKLFEQKYRGMYGTDPINPGPKDKQYFLNKMNYFYSHLVHESGGLTYAAKNMGPSRRDFKTLRDYGRGLQSMTKYFKQVGFDNEEIQKFQNDNISWAPIPIWPKFRNLIFSKFYDLMLTHNPKAQDGRANFEREFLKNKMKLLRQQETKVATPNGTLPQDQFSDVKSPEDVDFIFQIGGIKLPIEIGLKDDIDTSLEASGFDMLQRMLIEDLVDIGGSSLDTVIRNGKIVVDYVDFARVIVRPSIYPDYRDSDVRGYVAEKKISELLMIDQPSIQAHWDQLKNAYGSGVGPYSSYVYGQGQGYRQDYARNEQQNYGFTDFGTTVVKLYWLDTDMRRFLVGKRSSGATQYEEVPADFTLSKRGERAGKYIESRAIQQLYKCSMVLGTDIIYDFGQADSIVPPGEIGVKSMVWPMQIMSAQEPSLTEKVIPFIDDIQISLLKRRDLITKMPPGPRMVVYKSMIKDGVTLGGKKYSFRDLLSMYQREGVLLLDEKDEYSLPGEDINSKKEPIKFMQTGIAEDLQLLETNIDLNIDKIRQISGVNEVADGSSGNPDMLKSMVSSLQMAANNALRPWVDLYVSFYKNVTQSLMWTYQVYRALGLIEQENNWGPYGQLYRSFGVELLRYDMGLTIEVNDKAYMDFLMQDLMSKREIIPPEIYFTIYNAINQGDLRKAEFFLIKASKEAGELAHQRQMEIAQATAQANRAAAIAAEQERRQTLATELEKTLKEEEFRAMIQDALGNSQLSRDKDFETHKSALEKDMAVAVVAENNQNRLNQ